ncbi:MAG: hypothetical protein QOC81_5013 [Thermoanaerobaculia bacterium]|nr:hypothetical protein [Thermoanaerobaculia bacterium]
MEYISAVKVVIDLARAFRDELKSRKQVGPITLGTLLTLYGELTAFADDLARLRKLVASDIEALEDEDRDFVHVAFDRMYAIGELLGKLNIAVLDLYYPGSALMLQQIRRSDASVHEAFTDYLADAFGVRMDDLPESFKIYKESSGLDSSFYSARYFTRIDTDGTVAQRVDALAPTVAELQKTIGEIIKTHWTIKELGIVG